MNWSVSICEHGYNPRWPKAEIGGMTLSTELIRPIFRLIADEETNSVPLAAIAPQRCSAALYRLIDFHSVLQIFQVRNKYTMISAPDNVCGAAVTSLGSF